MRCPHPGCGYVADRDISAARTPLLNETSGGLFEDPLCYLEPLSGTLTQGIQSPIPSHLCVGFNLKRAGRCILFDNQKFRLSSLVFTNPKSFFQLSIRT